MRLDVDAIEARLNARESPEAPSALCTGYVEVSPAPVGLTAELPEHIIAVGKPLVLSSEDPEDIRRLIAEVRRLRTILNSGVRVVARLKGKPQFNRTPRACPVWGRMADVFCVGSTTAHELCRDAGIDPDTGKDLEAQA